MTWPPGPPRPRHLINGIRTPSDRLPDNPFGEDQMRLEGSVCNLCIQRPAHQSFQMPRRTESGPPRTLRGPCLLPLFPFTVFWIFVKVNELREPADCQSACLDVKCLREAVAQVDRDPLRRQMLQLFIRMLRQRATYGCPSGQERKADG